MCGLPESGHGWPVHALAVGPILCSRPLPELVRAQHAGDNHGPVIVLDAFGILRINPQVPIERVRLRIGFALLASIETSCLHQQRKAVEAEVALEGVSEQFQPSLLRRIGELLALLRTGIFQPGYVLHVMHQLMHED
jgi:hypothetical protein